MRAADSAADHSQKQPGPNELRDHLANERTFLSWVRTVIAIIALGFVVARFALVAREIGGRHVDAATSRTSAAFGVALVIGGVILSVFATAKFLQIRRNIDRNVVNFSPTLDVALAVVVALGSVGLAVYLIVTS